MEVWRGRNLETTCSRVGLDTVGHLFHCLWWFKSCHSLQHYQANAQWEVEWRETNEQREHVGMLHRTILTTDLEKCLKGQARLRNFYLVQSLFYKPFDGRWHHGPLKMVFEYIMGRETLSSKPSLLMWWDTAGKEGKHTLVNPAGTRNKALSNWPIRTWSIMSNLFAKGRLNPEASNRRDQRVSPVGPHRDPSRNADPKLL